MQLSAPRSPAAWTWPAIWHGESGGWWRFLVTLSLYYAGSGLGIAFYTVVNLGLFKRAVADHPAHIQELTPLIGTLIITSFGLLGCFAGVRFIHRKPLAQIFTDGRPFGFGLALQSAAIWAVLWLGFTLPLPGAWQGLVQRTEEIPLTWLPVVLVMTIAAMTVGRATEEILFRGYLLTRVAAWVKRPWLAVCIVSLAFTALHRGNPAALTAITLFGIVWGVACIRSGTLAPMIGAHVVHDTMNVLLQPNTTNANASTTWLEVGLLALALCAWLAWLFYATRQRPANPPADSSHLVHHSVQETVQNP